MERVFHIIILIFLCFAIALAIGCGFPCSADNIGYANVINNSSTNTYNIYIDNEGVVRLSPGKSGEISVGEGEHEIIFKLVDTGAIACSWIATIEECETRDFSCSI